MKAVMIACTSDAPRKFWLAVRFIIHIKARMLTELAKEDTAMITNCAQDSLVLNRFQDCPMIKAASVRPKPLYPSGQSMAASSKSPVKDPTNKA